MKILRKVLAAIFIATILGIVGLVFWLKLVLPDSYTVTNGDSLLLAQYSYVTVDAPAVKNTRAVEADSNTGKYSVRLKLFGLLPIKTVWVQPVMRQSLCISGAPFGIKLFSDGVMAVGFSDIYTATGYQNPAKSAGIKMGDTIHSVNTVSVHTNAELQACVEESDGNPMLVKYTRKNNEYSTMLTPVKDASTGDYRIGMWVRDSSAGIGTLTCYWPDTGVFAGLGHAITDVDTGENIQVLSGEIVSVQLTGVAPSSAGSPGELKGILSAASLGDIDENSNTGVYGRLCSGAAQEFAGIEVPVAGRQQVVVGPATLYTCVNGSTPLPYAVEIERISYNPDNGNKNMIIRITDKQLLEVAGGIVQGMSGSPIIQNGYFVGAVTHVLVNDPSRGYAIFAETMLEQAAQTLEKALIKVRSAA